MRNIAIKVEHLSKLYRLGAINNGTLFRDIQTWLALKLGKEDPHSQIGENKYSGDKDHFWALKDISFEIQEGDRVGIIGKNGAGKSTLLKILSRVTAPSEGTIKIKGKVSSLLEVGTGFNGELTGRENIYLNGAILGMKKRQIDKKIDEIIDFSGIENHIDTPVKRYSSGMYVRLGFAVAAHLDSDILIADEVLAVGDAEFQKKALGKMEDLSTGQGRTVLFVSHQMQAVRSLCNKGIVLNHGKVDLIDSIGECISKYIDVAPSRISQDLSTVPRIARHLSVNARICSFSIRNILSDVDIVDSSKPCECRLMVDVFSDQQIISPEFQLTDGVNHISTFHAGMRNNYSVVLDKGIHTFVCRTAPLSLYSGEYFIDIALSSPGTPIDYIEAAYRFKVQYNPASGQSLDIQKNSFNGFVFIEYNWFCEDKKD